MDVFSWKTKTCHFWVFHIIQMKMPNLRSSNRQAKNPPPPLPMETMSNHSTPASSPRIPKTFHMGHFCEIDTSIVSSNNLRFQLDFHSNSFHNFFFHSLHRNIKVEMVDKCRPLQRFAMTIKPFIIIHRQLPWDYTNRTVFRRDFTVPKRNMVALLFTKIRYFTDWTKYFTTRAVSKASMALLLDVKP